MHTPGMRLMYKLLTLGTLRLVDPRGNEPLTGRRTALALLAYLARSGGAAVPRERLAALLWGHRPEERARSSLRQELFRLRGVVGDGLTVTASEAVLTDGVVELDVSAFESDLAGGRWASALARMEGVFLPGAEDLGSPSWRAWLEAERQALRQGFLSAADRCVETAVREARWADVEVVAERWLRVWPRSDVALAHLMRGLHMQDRTPEALSRYAAFEAWLGLEMDRAPSRELQELANQLRATPAPGKRRGEPGSGPGPGVLPRLVAGWRETAAGGSCAVLVRDGRPGSRRRLVGQFQRWTATEPEGVVRLAADLTRADSGAPLAALRSLLRNLADAPGILAAPDSDLAEVAVLVPALRDRLPALPPPVGGAGRLRAALHRVLGEIGYETPVLLTVMEPGRADTESLSLLLELAADLPPRCMLLLMAREDIPAPVLEAPIEHLVAAPGRGRWRVPAGAAAVLLVLASATALIQRSAALPPTLAIGAIEAGGDGDQARILPDLLATNLARVEGLRVLSARYLHGTAGGADPAALSAAARGLGAGELLEGDLVARNGDWVLHLRRVDLETGRIRGSYSVEAPDVFELADRATAAVAVGFGLQGGALRVADVTTRSLAAYRLYEEAVRAYHRGDGRLAERMATAALDRDSTFAMAAYFAGLATQHRDGALSDRYMRRAVRLAEGTSPREQLLIRATRAHMVDDPARLPLAESLAVQYPAEPHGLLLLGQGRAWAGDFDGALEPLRRVVAMDSAGLRGEVLRCVACDALLSLTIAQRMAGDLTAFEQTAREWLRWKPGSALAWRVLADALEGQQRFPEALEARRRAQEIAPGNAYDQVVPAVYDVKAGRYQRADARLRDLIRTGGSEVQQQARWHLIISLREQGRLREALALAREFRGATGPGVSAVDAPYEAIPQAQILFEMGRYEASWALFDSIAAARFEVRSPSHLARQRVWNLAHAAESLVRMGRLDEVLRLADHLELEGRLSAYGRDRLLHHHLRGLVYAARGQDHQAVDAFRRALFSLPGGYTRTNYELAHALLRLRRPAEAIEVLRPVLAAPVDVNNYYLTRAEVHSLLGRAFAAAGRQDSAHHYTLRAAAAGRAAATAGPAD